MTVNQWVSSLVLVLWASEWFGDSLWVSKWFGEEKYVENIDMFDSFANKWVNSKYVKPGVMNVSNFEEILADM